MQERVPPQESYGLPANAGSEGQGPSLLIQQNITSEGCMFGSHIVNTWQDTHVAVETARLVAEERHQVFIDRLTTVADENHRAEVAQLTGAAVRALQDHTRKRFESQGQLGREKHSVASNTHRELPVREAGSRKPRT